mmetsp:Transcript_71248/g.119240  ORF Transcript_71248/g.119240 Transcript_71248/m.119240 type:complete len:80 (+) Transcript_71248:103-342(+)
MAVRGWGGALPKAAHHKLTGQSIHATLSIRRQNMRQQLLRGCTLLKAANSWHANRRPQSSGTASAGTTMCVGRCRRMGT